MINKKSFTNQNHWTDVIVNEYRRFDPILGPHQCTKKECGVLKIGLDISTLRLLP